MTLICTDKLGKSFSRKGVKQEVLKDLDLKINSGDFTVIMGPSGAGKTTLLYALSGMDRPSTGRITFANTEISHFSADRLAKFRRDKCGFIFQQVHLLDSMSAMDNVLSVGLLTKSGRGKVVRRAQELFDSVGLNKDDRTKFPSMLSGGEAQRAALVRAMINQPSVIFADEPTGQLNSEYSQIVLDLLTKINKSGQSIVMVTHDLRSALRGNRILYLRDGSICGELDLGPWNDDPQRLTILTAFLSKMGW